MDLGVAVQSGCITRVQNDLNICIESNNSDEIAHGLWWAVFCKWADAFDLLYPHTPQSGRNIVCATLCIRLTNNTTSIVSTNPVWLKMFDRFCTDTDLHEVVHVLRTQWPGSESADFLEDWINLKQNAMLRDTIGNAFNKALRKI